VSSPGGSGGQRPGLDPELLAQLAAEVERLPIRDLLVQTVGTISSLAWGRIAGPGRDVDQARLAIDALRALVPVVAPTVSEQAGRDLHAVVSSLQLAFVRALGEQSPSAPPAPAADAVPQPPEEPGDGNG
jgi:hypothetical protein